MRLITWNCRVGGFRNKCASLAQLRPDVLAVQELESLDSVLLFAGECQPTFKHRATDPLTTRGTGILSYTETRILPVDESEPMSFHRYIATKASTQLQIVSVWTSAKDSVGSAYQQAHLGLMKHAEWIRNKPTVI